MRAHFMNAEAVVVASSAADTDGLKTISMATIVATDLVATDLNILITRILPERNVIRSDDIAATMGQRPPGSAPSFACRRTGAIIRRLTAQRRLDSMR
jgi:hypothetical protein